MSSYSFLDGIDERQLARPLESFRAALSHLGVTDGENKMTCRSKRYVKEVQLNDVIFFPLPQKKKKSDTDRVSK